MSPALRLVPRPDPPPPPLGFAAPDGHGGRLSPEHVRGLGLLAVDELDPTDVDGTRELLYELAEAATATRLDRDVRWSALQLARLGCDAGLAAELALLIPRPTTPETLRSVLRRGPSRLPEAADDVLAPTVEINLADWW